MTSNFLKRSISKNPSCLRHLFCFMKTLYEFWIYKDAIFFIKYITLTFLYTTFVLIFSHVNIIVLSRFLVFPLTELIIEKKKERATTTCVYILCAFSFTQGSKISYKTFICLISCEKGLKYINMGGLSA